MIAVTNKDTIQKFVHIYDFLYGAWNHPLPRSLKPSKRDIEHIHAQPQLRKIPKRYLLRSHQKLNLNIDHPRTKQMWLTIKGLLLMRPVNMTQVAIRAGIFPLDVVTQGRTGINHLKYYFASF